MKQKTKSICNCGFIGNRLAAVGVLTLGLLANVGSAQVTNNFNDGNGTDPTPLDQYPSAAGAGWTGPWTSFAGTAAALTASVTNTSPLNGGGNYLNWIWFGGTDTSTIRRQFATNANINIQLPYVVEFDYRLDGWFLTNASGTNNSFNTFTSSSDNIQFQENGEVRKDQSGKANYSIKVQGAAGSSQPGLVPLRWSFFDGAIAGNGENIGTYYSATNITFTTNQIYHFRLAVDPINRKYEGTVTDGVNTFNTTAAAGKKLNWRAFAPSDNDFNLTTGLAFISRASTVGEFASQAIDNLVVNQVPQDELPVQITQITPIKANTFYIAQSNLVFSVKTIGVTNTIPSSNTSLVLNGVAISYTNLTFTGADSDTNRMITFAGLQDNTIYEAILTVADQAGRTSAFSFFFDTFVSKLRLNVTESSTNQYYDNTITNAVTIIETENFNFDPTLTPCTVLQTDTTRTDRYIQNWLYGGPSQLSPTGETNIVDSYFGRPFVQGIDIFTPVAVNASNFRTCLGGVGIRNSPGDEYERPEVEIIGISETVNDNITNGTWLNYTHEYAQGNYLVYLRGSAQFSNVTYRLDRVTSDYKVSGQSTTNLGTFAMTNFTARREILKWYPLTASGTNVVLALNGKDTLRLNAVTGASNNTTYLNYMVFLPVTVPPTAGVITITNTVLNGSNFSFSFNTVASMSYTVQFTENLSNTNWTTLTNLIGNGSPAVIQNSLESSNRFYRVKNP